MKYVITTISSFLMIHHKAVNCKQLWSKFSKYTPCKIFCASHTFEYGVSRHWKRKEDGINLFRYNKKHRWNYIFWYISLLIEFNNIVFMIFSFSNNSHKINKMANIFLNKIDLHTFLTSRNTINHRKKPMFVNVSFGLHAYGMQLLPRRFTTQKYLHQLSFVPWNHKSCKFFQHCRLTN